MLQFSDGLSQCHHALGFFDVQVFDQAAVNDDNPFALGGGLSMGSDDLVR